MNPDLSRLVNTAFYQVTHLSRENAHLSLPIEFESLDERFFSLGQDDNYYETFNQFPEELRTALLRQLRDCAFDLHIFDRAINEYVMGESILRSVGTTIVRTRFNRLAHGNAVLTEFFFNYTLPGGGMPNPPIINFRVTPLSEPPTNVHALIGRNGVGKTRCIQNLARALVAENFEGLDYGTLISLAVDEWSFSGLVVVSFSAFDTVVMPTVTRSGMRAAMIGLPREALANASNNSGVDWRRLISGDFCRSLELCLREPRRKRLQSALETLEADPLFADARVNDLLDPQNREWREKAETLFKELSSGHAIVLLTITRLVELVDEKTIVLMDEPEGHLHPPLLAAFIRALSDLLSTRNGAALLATHSPVVLQELPRSCVSLLRRSGRVANIERPTIETFGENVGVLTREVFGLEVTNSGFHQLLKKVVSDQSVTFEAAIAHFNNQLGGEAQAVLRSLVAIRDQPSPPIS